MAIQVLKSDIRFKHKTQSGNVQYSTPLDFLIVDQGSTYFETWNNQIQGIVNSINNNLSTVNNFCQGYKANQRYQEGSYIYYNNQLYCCTSTIQKSTNWNNDKRYFQRTTISNQLTELFNNKLDKPANGTVGQVLTKTQYSTVWSDFPNEDVISTAVAQAVASWMSDNLTIPENQSYILDNSLTLTTAAAQAKATGDAINNVVKVSAQQPDDNFNKIWIHDIQTGAKSVFTQEEIQNIIAPAYTIETSYKKGDYIIYDGALYYITADVNANENIGWENINKIQLSISKQINSLKSALDYEPIPVNLNKSINTHGSTVLPGNISTENGWCCVCISCEPGEKFTITGNGGNSTRLWAFSNSSGIVLSEAGASEKRENYQLQAPENAAYFAFNSRATMAYAVVRGIVPATEIEGIKSALSKLNQYVEKEKANINDVTALYTDYDRTKNNYESFKEQTKDKETETKRQIQNLINSLDMKAEANDLAGTNAEIEYVKIILNALNKQVVTKADFVDVASAHAEIAFTKSAVNDIYKQLYTKANKNELGSVAAESERLIADVIRQSRAISTLQSDLADTNMAVSGKITKPRDSPTADGQMLIGNEDGTTEWIDPVSPTDEQMGEAVSDWLTEHPEVTTTVEDGSITMQKLSTDVKDVIENSSTAKDALVLGSEMAVSQQCIDRLLSEQEYTLAAYKAYENVLLTYAARFAYDGVGFLFFTDPHTMPSNRYYVSMREAMGQLKTIRAIFENTPAKYVICGGDWITVTYSLAEAILYGGRIPNLLREEVSERAYTVIGNHDLNVEATKDYALTEAQLSRIWFDKDVGYYTLDYNHCTCIMLDSGFPDEQMTAYRLAEIDWFANLLMVNIKPHLFGVIHIMYNQGETNLGQELTAIADAFNQRTSITLHGILYNFSNAVGKFHFMMSGHVHEDWITTINNIPVITTVDSPLGLALDCCYADFDNAVLYLDRVGKGASRSVNIIPNGGYQAAT